MFEQIDQLEQRVETLINLLEQTREDQKRLEQENQDLREQIQQRDAVGSENEQLLTQVQQLEGEVENRAAKESQIRDRLQSILSRINTIENDLQDSAPEAE